MTGNADDRYQRLAAMLLKDSLRVLATKPPKQKKKRERWQQAHDVEIAFWNTPRKAARWCELVGLDYDAIVSRLRRRALLPSV